MTLTVIHFYQKVHPLVLECASKYDHVMHDFAETIGHCLPGNHINTLSTEEPRRTEQRGGLLIRALDCSSRSQIQVSLFLSSFQKDLQEKVLSVSATKFFFPLVPLIAFSSLGPMNCLINNFFSLIGFSGA